MIKKFGRYLSALMLIAVIIYKFIDSDNIYATATTALDSFHTIEIHVHGRSLFITPEQNDRLSPYHWSNFAIGILFVVIVAMQRMSLQRKP